MTPSTVVRPPRSAAGFPAVPLLGVAVSWFGFHWDIATHIDVGRDGFLNVPHGTIIAGALVALVGAAGRTLRFRSTDQLRAGDVMSMTGAVLVFVALALDNWWHTIFGTDVTVWSPPHLALMTAFMLIVFGVLRTAVELRLPPVILCSISAAGFAIPALSLIEFQVGTPPFSMIAEPLAWAGLFGFSVGIAVAATHGWHRVGTTTAATMFVLQGIASAGNAALGRSFPIPQIGLVAAGVLFDVLRTRVATRSLARSSFVVGATAAALLACIDCQRTLVGRTWWTTPVIGAAVVPAIGLAIVGYHIGSRTITDAFYRAIRPRSLFVVSVAVFVVFAPTAYPLLTRSPSKQVVATVTATGNNLSILPAHADSLDSVSAFRRVPTTGHERTTELRFITQLRWTRGRFQGNVGTDTTDPILIWYVHGIRHYYGDADRGDTTIDLGQTDGVYEDSPLAGGFPITSVSFLFILIFVSMMALFRPDLLRLHDSPSPVPDGLRKASATTARSPR